MTNAAERAIREWVHRYYEDGIDGLASHWQGGNANRSSPEQRLDLATKLDEYTPDQVIGIDMRIASGVFWTVSDLRIVVQEWYGVSYSSDNSYDNLLHACGLSYQKAEKIFRFEWIEKYLPPTVMQSLIGMSIRGNINCIVVLGVY